MRYLKTNLIPLLINNHFHPISHFSNEDQYVEEIGKIIQRDFFPVSKHNNPYYSGHPYNPFFHFQDLEKLRAQYQYMEAMERNDTIKLRELYAKFTGRKPSERSGKYSLSLSLFIPSQ